MGQVLDALKVMRDAVTAADDRVISEDQKVIDLLKELATELGNAENMDEVNAVLATINAKTAEMDAKNADLDAEANIVKPPAPPAG